MSDEFLNQILQESIEIMKTSLREELNMGENTAVFTPNIIYEAVYRQLRFTSVRNITKNGNKKQTRTAKYEAWKLLKPNQKETIKAEIKRKAEAIMSDLITEYRSFKQPGVDIKVEGTPKRFTVSTVVTDRNKLVKGIGRGGAEYEIDAFAAIRIGYSSLMKSLWKEIADMVQEQAGIEDKNLSSSVSFADLEHAVGESVAEKQVSAGITNLYNQVYSKVRSEQGTKQVFEELGLSVFLEYVSTDSVTVAKLRVGSKSKNRRQAIKERMALKVAQSSLEQALRKNLATGDKIKSWKGSDDRITIEKKKIVEAFNKSVALRVNSIDTKRKLSKKTTRAKTVKINKKNTQVKVKPISLVQKEKVISSKARSSAQSDITLAALINRALPATIGKNMSLPGLQYRTGRFASSVQVTDVTRTTKGYPSIGYTYQKYPYQTFEPGYRQGSVDRDPRKVIDRSIREIAAELLVGRFYTRRV